MFFRIGWITVPAYFALALWLLVQVISSMAGNGHSGVSYVTHLGGAAAGLVLWLVYGQGADREDARTAR